MTHLFIVMPGKLGPEGHEQQYTRLLLDAAALRGWPAGIVSIPDDTKFVTEAAPRTLLSRAVNRLRYERTRHRRIAAWRGLFAVRGRANALFILHTASYDEMGLIARAFAAAARQGVVGRLAIVLRYDHYDDEAARSFIATSLAPATQAPIDLFSDSADLCDLLAPLAAVRIGLVHPPCIVTPRAVARAPLLGYFGARRTIKGFTHLPAVIDAAQAIWNDLGAFVQCYPHPHDPADPAIDAALATLHTMPYVDLLESTLSPDAYATRLARCAAVLLPYDSHHYRAGTSGIFVEAVASGAAVVATTGSWMEKEAKRYGLTRVVACDWSDPRAAGTVAAQAARKALEPWLPTRGEHEWIAAHAPCALLATLAGETG